MRQNLGISTYAMPELPETRSRIMRAVRSRDTTPELVVRKLLYSLGYRYRLHSGLLPGKPDLVFASRRKVLFVHGCFWHGHDCPRGRRVPQTNREYWESKIRRNVARDELRLAQLQALGWKSLIVWECQLRDTVALKARLKRYLRTSHARPGSL